MKLDIAILQSIKESQAQHGLKYENYQSYRSYCSRRLHRLRRSINVHDGIPSSAKARHQRARKMININSAMVLEAGEKDTDYGKRLILIPLYLAERVWSYAMQLKQDAVDQPRKKYHLQRRLRKAMVYAQKFEDLCHEEDSPCSEKTKIESEAYAAYISGLYHFEREDWFQAKESLSLALNIYFKLNLWFNHQERIDEIKASLRYCNFNLGGETKNAALEIPSKIKFHNIAYRHALELISKKGESDDDDEEENWDDACEDW